MCIAKACSLRRNGSRSLGEMAHAMGLTHSHFSVVFLRRLGMPPTQSRDVQQG